MRSLLPKTLGTNNALGKIGADATAAILGLAELLRDSEREVR